MRAFLLAMLFMLIGTAAQAQLTLCNRADRPIEVAWTEENKGVLQVTGWKRIAPDACARITTNRQHAYAYYAHAPGTDWEWVGEEDGEEFCVHMNRGFRIDYDGIDEDYLDADDFACPAGAEKRSFTVLEKGVRHTIDLD
jgi:uncharacterized membrane protein